MSAFNEDLLEQLSRIKFTASQCVNNQYQQGLSSLLTHKMMMHQKLGSDLWNCCLSQNINDFKNSKQNYDKIAIKLEENYRPQFRN